MDPWCGGRVGVALLSLAAVGCTKLNAAYEDTQADNPAGDSTGGTQDGATGLTEGDPSVTTEDVDPSESTSTGEPGDPNDPCGGCSDHGRCVLVDDEPTCACDPGWTMVGLECLEDACNTTKCYYVDTHAASGGNGSLETPWSTFEEVFGPEGAAFSAGDHVLFRRGRYFETAGFQRALVGRTDAPIVIGAYGPPAEAKPVFTGANLRLVNSSHVVLRDLDLIGSEMSPCLALERSDWITAHDNDARQCGNHGISVTDQSHHIAIFRNHIHGSTESNVFVSDTGNNTQLGEHHWIAGNTISGTASFGVYAFFDGEARPLDIGDIKVVDNQIHGAASSGLSIAAPTGWVVGNIIVDSVGAANDYQGGLLPHEAVRSWLHIRSNIVSGANGSLVVRWDGFAEKNSLFQAGGENPIVRVATNYEGMSVLDNVVFGAATRHIANPSPVSDQDGHFSGNRYASTMEGGCVFGSQGQMNLEDWQNDSGTDDDSVCEVIPGISSPPASVVPVSQAYMDAVSPDPKWDPCETAGAIDCEGRRRPVRFRPNPGDDDKGSAGLGWEGPLLIRQHYPLIEP